MIGPALIITTKNGPIYYLEIFIEEFEISAVTINMLGKEGKEARFELKDYKVKKPRK
jgi:hypothetical protein